MAGIPGVEQGSTFGGDVGTVAAGAMGFTPEAQGGFWQSHLYNIVSNLPDFHVTTGWNAYRMSNSLLYGGFGGNHGRLRNHIHPRALLRVTDPNAMLTNGAAANGYSIFNLAGITNQHGSPQGAAAAARRQAAKEATKAGKAISGAALDDIGASAAQRFNETRRGGWYKVAVNRGWASPGADLAEAGFLSKLSTGMRLANMGDSTVAASRMGARMMARTGSSGLVATYGAAGMSGRAAAAHYMSGAFTSILGARAGGYMAGARLGGMALTGGVTGRAAAEAMAGRLGVASAYVSGASKAGAHLAGGGLRVVGNRLVHEGGRRGVIAAGIGIRQAAKAGGVKAAAKTAGAVGARAAGLAVPGLNLAMGAWLAYDVGKMVFGAARENARKAKEMAQAATKSLKGQIEKPVFGMGFVDNEVAASSRQRGVMAIQNSRLNARSILGSEAGPLHAHFG